MRISGIVVIGKGESRKLGYPTANLEYDANERLVSGVWCCRSEVDGKKGEGLAVVGMWTLANGLPSVEVHLFDFDADLHGRRMDVLIENKLSDLRPFVDAETLIGQIRGYILQARGFFSSN